MVVEWLASFEVSPTPLPHPKYHRAVRAGVDISQSRYDSCESLWVIIYYKEVSLQWKAFLSAFGSLVDEHLCGQSLS